MSLKEHISFLGQYVLKPGVIGAVAPSSRGLARRMVEWIDWPSARAVLEYGPGTGVFTRHILSWMRPETSFLAIEVNPRFVEVLARRYPDVRVRQDSVANVKAICEKEGIDAVDAIVSGLPWAAFRREQQVDFLGAMMRVLRPGGQFVTFAYLQGLLLPAGRRFKGMLSEHFSRIERSKVAWANVPPAFVYRCRR